MFSKIEKVVFLEDIKMSLIAGTYPSSIVGEILVQVWYCVR